eukprot:TRINITY_DN296_c1_g1_i17.p1 TRINITY_DN296_c1_g1~~TRINITY_DN296_c1_g1_i17.p1  ORF type:complete len:634 (+),score=26.85 TRINITY_DN296_c1_g1_i17:1496-3397(+)
MLNALEYWEKLPEFSSEMREWIVKGCPIGWVDESRPLTRIIKNHKSVDGYKNEVRKEILDMVRTGKAVVVPPEFKGMVVHSPLKVVLKNNGNIRLIHNLRGVNKFLKKFEFKMETLSKSADLIFEGDFMSKIDITSAYQHCRVLPEDARFLCFEFEGTSYMSLVFPFGMRTSPFLFQRFMRVMSLYWRKEFGFRFIQYLDDIGMFAESLKHATLMVETIKSQMESLGWLISPKSELKPKQVMTFLGLGIDTKKGVFFVEEEKLNKLVNKMGKLQRLSEVTARDIASVAGKLQSLSLAIGGTVRLFSRGLFAAIKDRIDWDSPLDSRGLSSTLEDLTFWIRNLTTLPEQKLISSPMTAPIVTMKTDASDLGYGGSLYLGNEVLETAGPLTVNLRGSSSSVRELYGVFKCFQAFKSKIARGSILRILSDSQVAVQGIKFGSRTDSCQVWTKRIALLALENGIQWIPEWIPRELNVVADKLSREVTEPELVLSDSAFSYICNIFKICPKIDRFASLDSRKCAQFNSKWFTAEASATDCFSVSWDIGKGWNYCFPPEKLVKSTVRKAIQDKCKMLLIVPKHFNSSWWGFLTVNNDRVSSALQIRRGEIGILNGDHKLMPISTKFGFVAVTVDYSNRC